MKLLRILSIIILFAAFTACEKAVLDDDDNTDKTEKPTEKPDNPGSGDSGDESDNDSDDSDQIVEPGDDDNNPPVDETDIVDGNDPDEDDNKENDPDKAMSVTDFINKSVSGGVYVEGYIVGSCTRNIKNADFDAPFKGQTAVLLADTPDEQNTENVISINLKSGSKMRAEVNLEDNPGNKGRRLRVFGYRETYLGIWGIKSVSSGMYELF